MRFSTIFTVLACGAMTMAAVISPVALAKRDVEVSVVIETLNGKCDDLIPQLGLFPFSWSRVRTMLTLYERQLLCRRLHGEHRW